MNFKLLVSSIKNTKTLNPKNPEEIENYKRNQIGKTIKKLSNNYNWDREQQDFIKNIISQEKSLGVLFTHYQKKNNPHLFKVKESCDYSTLGKEALSITRTNMASAKLPDEDIILQESMKNMDPKENKTEKFDQDMSKVDNVDECSINGDKENEIDRPVTPENYHPENTPNNQDNCNNQDIIKAPIINNDSNIPSRLDLTNEIPNNDDNFFLAEISKKMKSISEETSIALSETLESARSLVNEINKGDTQREQQASNIKQFKIRQDILRQEYALSSSIKGYKVSGTTVDLLDKLSQQGLKKLPSNMIQCDNFNKAGSSEQSKQTLLYTGTIPKRPLNSDQFPSFKDQGLREPIITTQENIEKSSDCQQYIITQDLLRREIREAVRGLVPEIRESISDVISVKIACELEDVKKEIKEEIDERFQFQRINQIASYFDIMADSIKWLVQNESEYKELEGFDIDPKELVMRLMSDNKLDKINSRINSRLETMRKNTLDSMSMMLESFKDLSTSVTGVIRAKDEQMSNLVDRVVTLENLIKKSLCRDLDLPDKIGKTAYEQSVAPTVLDNSIKETPPQQSKISETINEKQQLKLATLNSLESKYKFITHLSDKEKLEFLTFNYAVMNRIARKLVKVLNTTETMILTSMREVKTYIITSG